MSSTSIDRTYATILPSAAVSMPAPARRSHVPRRASPWSDFSIGRRDIRICEAEHGPATARRYRVCAHVSSARSRGAAPRVQRSLASRRRRQAHCRRRKFHGSVQGEYFALAQGCRELAVDARQRGSRHAHELAVDDDLSRAVRADSINGTQARTIRGNQHFALLGNGRRCGAGRILCGGGKCRQGTSQSNKPRCPHALSPLGGDKKRRRINTLLSNVSISLSNGSIYAGALSSVGLCTNAHNRHGLMPAGHVRRNIAVAKRRGAAAAAQRGCMRMAPSKRTVSPFR